MSKISKARSKLIRFFIIHLEKISIYLYIIGILSFLIFPWISRPVYFSENALSVGSIQVSKELGDSKWQKEINELFNHFLSSYSKMQEENRISKSFNVNFESKKNNDSNHLLFLKKVKHYFSKIGIIDSQIHEYKANNRSRAMYNFYTSVRASKAPGKESLAIIVPLRSDQSENNNQRLWNIVLGIQMMKHFFFNIKWLHKDLIFVISDHLEGNSTSVSSSWVSSHDEFPYLPEEIFLSQNLFSVGRIREALIIDFENFGFSFLSLLTEGFNGELPNLDLVNILNYYAGKEGLVTSINHYHEHYPSVYITDSLLSKWKKKKMSYDFKQFYLALLENIKRYIFLGTHLWHQLLGIPTGIHAPFRKRMTHSVSLTDGITPVINKFDIALHKKELSTISLRSQNIIAVARTIEATTRSLNALLEELHQSYFLYFLDSTQTFLGFEDYSPTMWLIVGGLTVLKPIGAFYGNLHSMKNIMRSISMIIYVILTFGVSVFLIPFLTSKILDSLDLILNYSTFLRIWVLMSLISCSISYFLFQRFDQWVSQTLILILDENKLSKQEKTKEYVSFRETGNLFILSFAGIGLLTVLPLSPALSMSLGIYIGLLYWVNTIYNPQKLILRLILIPFNILRFIIHFALNPLLLIVIFSFNESLQNYLLKNGFKNNMYEFIIFPALCLIALPSWIMFQLLR